MNSEQRKRAFSLIIALSSFGLISGVWSVILPRGEGDPPSYVLGMMMTVCTAVIALLLNFIAAEIRFWVMGETSPDSLTHPFWKAP